MTGWGPFRLSNGYVFNCQGTGQTAQVGPFSIVKWVPFRLTKTALLRSSAVAPAFIALLWSYMSQMASPKKSP